MVAIVNARNAFGAEKSMRELLGGSDDLEAAFAPAFYLGCRRRFSRWPWPRIAAYQTARARNVVRYAARFAPFYAEHYRGHDLTDPWTLPTVDKAAVMEHLTGANTLGFTRDELLGFCLQVEATRDFTRRLRGVNVGMSSGTSGNKGVELTTRREEAYLKAALFARFPLPPGKLNLAFILRVTTPAFDLNLLGHRMTYLSQLLPLDEMVERLNALMPNAVSAPPSLLRLLAGERRAGRLRATPSTLVSYAEVLFPDDRADLEDAFGCPVREIYKATEGAIAVSCRHGRLHLNEDLVAVQLEDPDGTPTPPGEAAHRMIVTDLHKTSLPILRYELNDLVTLDPEPCPCGSAFRVVAQIQGRRDDLFWSPSLAGGARWIFPDYLRRAIITASDAVHAYQAVQTAPDAVTVHLSVGAGTDADAVRGLVGDAVRRVFTEHGCPEPGVTVDREAPRPHATSLKLVRIRRTFDVPRGGSP